MEHNLLGDSQCWPSCSWRFMTADNFVMDTYQFLRWPLKTTGLAHVCRDEGEGRGEMSGTNKRPQKDVGVEALAKTHRPEMYDEQINFFYRVQLLVIFFKKKSLMEYLLFRGTLNTLYLCLFLPLRLENGGPLALLAVPKPPVPPSAVKREPGFGQEVFPPHVLYSA